MKTISIYELLGLIKDGKAPIKVKWRDKIWLYYDIDQDYEVNGTDLLGYGFCNNRTLDFINDTVEIIEEDKKIEFEEIEEFEGITECVSNLYSGDSKMVTYYPGEQEIMNKLIRNQKKIIDEINKLKEEKE